MYMTDAGGGDTMADCQLVVAVSGCMVGWMDVKIGRNFFSYRATHFDG